VLLSDTTILVGKLKYQMRSHRFTPEQSEIVAGRITKLLCEKDMKVAG